MDAKLGRVLKQLQGSPLDAFLARQTLQAQIDLSNQPQLRTDNAKKRLRVAPNEWVAHGFAAFTSDGSSLSGAVEWVTFCVQVLKKRRSSSHPERSCGVDIHAASAAEQQTPRLDDGADAVKAVIDNIRAHARTLFCCFD